MLLFPVWSCSSQRFYPSRVNWFAFAAPLAWWVLNHFILNRYEYRINFEYWVLGAVGVLALLLTLIIVSTQALKAATANPTKKLKMRIKLQAYDKPTQHHMALPDAPQSQHGLACHWLNARHNRVLAHCLVHSIWVELRCLSCQHQRTYRVVSLWKESKSSSKHFSTPFPLANAIRTEASGFEQVAFSSCSCKHRWGESTKRFCLTHRG